MRLNAVVRCSGAFRLQLVVFVSTLCGILCSTNILLIAQQTNQQVASSEFDAVRQALQSYIEAFNRNNADEVAKFWALDCVSIAEDSGDRIEGRDAIQKHFTEFFSRPNKPQLAGEIVDIRMIRPDVAMIEGRTTLLVAEEEPIESLFSATMVKEGRGWLITHSKERDLLPATNPSQALQELDWLVGEWQDQSESSLVSSTVRWSPNQSFLIRSYAASIDTQDMQGTQIFGWDPRTRQIRTWVFHSDGSFGQGTVSKHDDSWLFKTSQTLADGRLASGTQVVTRVDENTLTVQTIGETVEGELVPSSAPVTVVRTTASDLSVTPNDVNGKQPSERK